jgi:hypothetical protein
MLSSRSQKTGGFQVARKPQPLPSATLSAPDSAEVCAQACHHGIDRPNSQFVSRAFPR